MCNENSDKKPLIAVAGGSGFVGSHLRRKLSSEFRFRALTRSTNIANNKKNNSTEWVKCDLYSLPRVSKALKGCNYGIYLVHSMAPSSRLLQGNFEDLDLLLADNFIRAAEEAGLEHVIYLSGLMPDDTKENLSSHLKSRLEVESVLKSRNIRVTVLRAGIIFGPGGSSFSILINLVRRLPIMIFPSWTHSMTQSIDINDVCRAFKITLKEKRFQGNIYDLNGHEPMSYIDLVHRVGNKLGRSFISFSIPYNFFFFSKHWLSLLGGVPLALAEPLQKSLIHNLRAKPNELSEEIKSNLTNFDRSFELSVNDDGSPKPNPRSKTQKKDRIELHQESKVRSVQRMPLPDGWSAHQISREYSKWLSRKFAGIISAKNNDDGKICFYFINRILLLELTPTPYSIKNFKRSAYYISNGLMMKQVEPKGRFEFRIFPESHCVIAAIHGYVPMLPWRVYSCTQALIHLKVMRSFSKYLKSL